MKTVLITGASKGIGLKTSLNLLKKGFSVIGISRQKPDISHPNFTSYLADLSKPLNLETTFSNVLKNHKEISSLVLNAGVGYFGYLEQLSATKMAECLNTNFFSHALLCKSFIAHLKKLTRSDIVFIGSEAALKGSKAGSIYCASKFALKGFFQSLQQECNTSNVRVSMINPGMVRTGFHKNTYFEPGPSSENAIDAESIADVIEMILSSNQNISFDEINVSPLKKVVSFKEKRKVGTQKGSLLNLIKKP